MSDGRLQAPLAKDAMPVATLSTVASPAAAGPAAAGPMTGERKPKMPAKVSPAEAVMLFNTPLMVDAMPAVDPLASAPVRAATPVVTAAVFAASPVVVAAVCAATPARQSANGFTLA